MDINTTINSFTKYFYVTAATTPKLLEDAYRIRYQVYCQEFHFEKEENCPTHAEQDDYDAQALHCLLIHKPTGVAVGCSRLILPHPSNPELPLPFERYCKHSLDPTKVDFSQLDRRSFGEVSRLAVIPQFRRRSTDEKDRISLPDPQAAPAPGRGAYPIIPVSLFLGVSALFLTTNLHCAFAMMEPKLARMLWRYGFHFSQVGAVIDYHGPRAPYQVTRETTNYFTPEVQALMRIIIQQVSRVSLQNIA